jgi:hypothetical protein
MYTEKGTFTHDGVKYDLEGILKEAHRYPIMNFYVRDLAWVLKYDTPREDRVQRADLSAPILVAYSKNGDLTVVDGLHRLAKAKREKIWTLPGKLIDQDLLDKHRIRDLKRIASRVSEAWLMRG